MRGQGKSVFKTGKSGYAGRMTETVAIWKIWLMTTRPKTLFAALAPVVMGATMARADGRMDLPGLGWTLLAAVLIQVGTNFCNDLFDHRQGADTEKRQGPRRALQSGRVTPRGMALATAGCFVAAAAAAWPLYLRGGRPILWIAAASILSGIFYTAGRKSLAYTGLADVFVIVFFGPVATAGTYFVQIPLGWPPLEVFLVGLGPGLIATGLLAVNNLRDMEEDKSNNKRTLTVRFGREFSRWEYKVCLTLALVLPPIFAVWTGRSLLVLALFVLVPEVRRLMQRVSTGESGAELNPALAGTGQFLFQYALLFAVTWPHCALCIG